MTTPINLSLATANYLQNSGLGKMAQNAGAEDKNINEIIDEKTSLTDKVRYMDANTELVQAVKNVFESNVVGSNINVQFGFLNPDETKNEKLNNLWEKKFRLWSKAEFCTVQGKYHFTNTMRQSVKAEKGAEGEVLVLHHFDPSKQWKPKNTVKANKDQQSAPSPFAYKTQLVETSMIDESKDRDVVLTTTGKIKEYAIVGGLMIGEYDRVLGVYIYDDQSKNTSTFYTREMFALYFDPHLRISQYRGISRMSGVIGSVQDTITYKDTELQSASKAAETKYVHKTSLIKPYVQKQEAEWKQRYSIKGIPISILDMQVLNQDSTPTKYIDLDDEFKKLDDRENSSQYEAFVKTGNIALASNYGIAKGTVVKGDGDSVFAVVKAEKQENGLRFEIDQDNLVQMLVEPIINNFIEIHALEFGIKDFRQNKYNYLYNYTVTMGSKTELDEAKSANARKTNKEQNVIDDYQAARQLGNDLDTILENNTRSKQKQMEELTKILTELSNLNKEANDQGMNFKLDENNNIVQDMDYNKEETSE